MVDGVLCEPMELVVIDVPEQFIGVVTERLGERRGRMVKMANPGFGRARLEYRIPSRGDDRLPRRAAHGHARHRAAQLDLRRLGALGRHDDEARRRARSCPTAPAWRRRTRCTTCSRAASFFVAPGAEVYEGMIVGEHNRPNDTDVNVIKEKKLSNVRNHGKDENVMLAPPRVAHDRDGHGVDRRRRARRGHARRRARAQADPRRSTCARAAARPSRTRRAFDSAIRGGCCPGRPVALGIVAAAALAAVGAQASSSVDELVRQARAHEARARGRRRRPAVHGGARPRPDQRGRLARAGRAAHAASARPARPSASIEAALRRVPTLHTRVAGPRARAVGAGPARRGRGATSTTYAPRDSDVDALRELAGWYGADGAPPRSSATWRALVALVAQDDAARARGAPHGARARQSSSTAPIPSSSPAGPDATRRGHRLHRAQGGGWSSLATRPLRHEGRVQRPLRVGQLDAARSSLRSAGGPRAPPAADARAAGEHARGSAAAPARSSSGRRPRRSPSPQPLLERQLAAASPRGAVRLRAPSRAR